MGTSINQRKDAVQVTFEHDPKGLYLNFFDPAYLRAETLLLDKRDHSLHAVMHEQLVFLTHVDYQHAQSIQKIKTIRLMSRHAEGQRLELSAPLRVA